MLVLLLLLLLLCVVGSASVRLFFINHIAPFFFAIHFDDDGAGRHGKMNALFEQRSSVEKVIKFTSIIGPTTRTGFSLAELNLFSFSVAVKLCGFGATGATRWGQQRTAQTQLHRCICLHAHTVSFCLSSPPANSRN